MFCEDTRKRNQPHSCLRQTITLLVRRTNHADPCVDTPIREWPRRRRRHIEKERRGRGGSRSSRFRRFSRRWHSPGCCGSGSSLHDPCPWLTAPCLWRAADLRYANDGALLSSSSSSSSSPSAATEAAVAAASSSQEARHGG